MTDRRTDEEKQSSPYFDHWVYTGSRIQQMLQIGPRKAIFKPMMTEQAAQAIVDAGESASLDTLFGGGLPEVIYTGFGSNRKAVNFQQWLKDALDEYNEGKGQSKYYRKGSWAYRCIEIRAQALQAVPWALIDENGQEIENADVLTMLREVNPEANWTDLIGATSRDLDIHGKAFWLKVGREEPTQSYADIQRINPSLVEVIASSKGISGFKIGPQGAQKEYPRESVVYFHTYDPDNDAGGLAPLQVAKDSVEVEIYANEHLKAFFKNQAMGTKLFSLETSNPDDIKKVAQAWKKEHQQQNVHGVDFVGGGAIPHDMSYAPKDLALKDAREEARKEICAVFGVPPTMAGAWEAANYATAQVDQRSLYTTTIDPFGKYIAGVITAELVADFMTGIRFVFKVHELDVMQDVIGDKADAYSRLVESGTIKPEAAVRELHLQDDDVGPGPQQQQQQPVPFRAIKGETEELELVSDDDSHKTEVALSKWHRKAMNRLDKGQEPACDFESEYINPVLHSKVSGELETAIDKNDVDEIFNEAEQWMSYG